MDGWAFGSNRLPQELATGLALQTTEGALVASLEKGSPAEKAGVMQGDVITAVNGTPVRDPKVLAKAVEIIAPGTDARLSVIRNGDTVDLTIAVGERQGQTAAVAEKPGKSKVGLLLSPLDNDLRKKYRIHASVEGVVVVAIQPGSVAARHGIRPGDVIKSVKGKTVKNPEDVQALLKRQDNLDNKEKEFAILLLSRKNLDQYIALPLSVG